MRLVVQGSAISISHLTHIHRLCNTSVQFVQIAQHAYYLANQPPLPSVQQFCADQHIDCAYVDDKQHINNFGLCVMDMDSTLINIECIDEIADMMNLKPQVSAITESAMRGEIDFATSLKQRVALLKGLDESALQRVIDERLKLNPGALEWIAACKVNHIKTMVVSGGFTLFANHVQKLLGLDYAVANTFEVISGKLTGQILGDIVDADRKAQELVKLRDDLGLTPDQTIAIGDGANDLKMMSAAGVGVAYHAKPIVQQQTNYALNFVGLDGIANLLIT
ncbi:MAG: phosphoserine phosphatase SerB [Methylotenera sp.]|nr:phosphoserine phosphatase SerB [Methylotenera sp.]MDO9233387.1 phosphoserine phosphatase SerB [Methylotenera sp.]MDO9387982.1 phosphoserine phosphatase SerB [Methylotenera sp.]MDP2101876.1 phosphoserine phosphatase SerB [Methylotenera sp.]MDP2280788.1 phosphoserine phosphatase SerB [Methylotenera sp.]